MVDVREEIERVRFAPNMSGERAQRPQADAVGQASADFGEDFLEYPSHRQNRGPGVDLDAADFDLSHFPAGRRVAFENGYGEAARRQQHGADQPANPGPDDRDTPRPHRFASAARIGLIAET
jgi:hypothetical protein